MTPRKRRRDGELRERKGEEVRAVVLYGDRLRYYCFPYLVRRHSRVWGRWPIGAAVQMHCDLCGLKHHYRVVFNEPKGTPLPDHNTIEALHALIQDTVT